MKKRPIKKVRKQPKQAWIWVFLAILTFLSFFLVKNQLQGKLICANSISCVKDLSGHYEANRVGVFQGSQVLAPEQTGPESVQEEVLGEVTQGISKHIYVDLTSQRLSAYEGSQLILYAPVSTGKWYPTPPGEFRIWTKLRYTRMTGGNPTIGTYYNLPNVPFTMYFYNSQYPKARGYGLHGAYWHNNFGHPMSHGCVNMKIEDAGRIFEWARVGTPITITGTTPVE